MTGRSSSLLIMGAPSEQKQWQERDNKMPRSRSPKKLPPTSAKRPQVSAKLRKQSAATSDVSRSASIPYLAMQEPTLPDIREMSLRDLQHQNVAEPAALLPPPPIVPAFSSRSSSREESRHGSIASTISMPSSQLTGHGPILPISPVGEDADKQKKKHWWSRAGKKSGKDAGPKAWIAGHPQSLAYDVDGLVNGRPAQELWDQSTGNCFVYLFPQTAGKGASFKIDSAVIASSPVLTQMAFGEASSHGGSMPRVRMQVPLGARASAASLNDPSTPPASPKSRLSGTRVSTSSDGSYSRHSASSDAQSTHLFLPIKLSTEVALTDTPPRSEDAAAEDDMQTLVDYRNFFAFLCGSSLVATERRSSLFSIFMTIAGLLKSFQFSNIDGSTFGNVADASFDSYVEELGLADVRASREQTIEGLVLGEHMKSVFLYNEAFTHAVGKHQDLLALKSSKFHHISPITQNRLTRAYMDLEKRTANVRLTLDAFEFPALFSGIMSSKTNEERKLGVRYDQWKESFLGMRKFVIGHYKNQYGDWPPKASSKKNTLETSGLNRTVLRDVYYDLSSLYDLLVDRNSLTTRTIDGIDLGLGKDEPNIRGLRSVLSEYDRSSPPVKPPVPFDLPNLPTHKTTQSNVVSGNPKKVAKDAPKKMKDDEILKVLRASWNADAKVTPFVDAFRDMEKRAAHGCSIAELEDLRIGQWIFMYVVLQALPMLACDAPGLKWTHGCEYFLCEAPQGGVPWADASVGGPGRRTWFSVGGQGGGVVSLPADLIEHGVEGIYRRSHCWQMAERWCANNPLLNEALHEQQHSSSAGMIAGSSLSDPSGTGARRPDSRASARSAQNKRPSIFGGGLEALPMPAGVSPAGNAASPVLRPRTPQHAVDTSKTFDAILANVDAGKTKKKK